MEVKKQNKFALFAIIGLFAIVVLLLTDILIGMSNIGFKDIIDSIFNYNKSKEHLIITTISLLTGEIIINIMPSSALRLFITFSCCTGTFILLFLCKGINTEEREKLTLLLKSIKDKIK